MWFFKTGKGQYGEGDKFLGVSNPQMRKIAVEFFDLPIGEIEKLLKSPLHEFRQTALFILARQFEKGDEKKRKKIFDFYISHTRFVNNWDLVDCSAHKIVGCFLWQKKSDILIKLARSKNIWERRIAVVSTFYFIKKGDSEKFLRVASILIKDREDLIHKALGWMLREVGKCCGQEIEENFLKKNYDKLARTTLRYAIERFPEQKRKMYLRGNI